MWFHDVNATATVSTLAPWRYPCTSPRRTFPTSSRFRIVAVHKCQRLLCFQWLRPAKSIPPTYRRQAHVGCMSCSLRWRRLGRSMLASLAWKSARRHLLAMGTYHIFSVEDADMAYFHQPPTVPVSFLALRLQVGDIERRRSVEGRWRRDPHGPVQSAGRLAVCQCTDPRRFHLVLRERRTQEVIGKGEH